MPTIQSEIIQDSERIVILYANYSGRESAHRGEFRTEVEEILQKLIKSRDAQIVEMLEGMRQIPTKHDRCTLDDNYCYDHKEEMSDEDLPNGATDYNKALDDAIKSLKDSK